MMMKMAWSGLQDRRRMKECLTGFRRSRRCPESVRRSAAVTSLSLTEAACLFGEDIRSVFTRI